MARRREAPHLLWVKSKVDKSTGKLRARGYWAIADGTKRVSTGFSLEQRADAEKARLDYEVKLYAEQSASEIVEAHGKGVRDVLVVDLIRFWLDRKADVILSKSDEQRRNYLHTIERLIKFWEGKTVFNINEKTIKEYGEKSRAGKPLASSTQLRELAELKSIVNFGIKKGLCELEGHIVDWELPPPPEPRMTFFSRSEVAKLLWTAYRKKVMHIGKPGVGVHTSKHIARFILVAVWTGTRSERIEDASFVDYDDRPWIDTESGIFYRAGVPNKSPVNKQARPVRIPDGLLAHLRRWEKEGEDLIKGRGTTKKGFYNLKHEVFSEARAKKVNRHTFKHTCASWNMQRRVPISIIASFLSTTEEVILRHYGHFSPDFHMEINTAAKNDRQERMVLAAAAKLAREKAKLGLHFQEAAE